MARKEVRYRSLSQPGEIHTTELDEGGQPTYCSCPSNVACKHMHDIQAGLMSEGEVLRNVTFHPPTSLLKRTDDLAKTRGLHRNVLLLRALSLYVSESEEVRTGDLNSP